MSTFRVINGIATKIKEYYPDDNISLDEIEQGFKRPCWQLKLVNYTTRPTINNHWWVEHFVDVIRFASDKDYPSQELFNDRDILSEILEEIPYTEYDESQKLIRGMNIKFNQDEDILHALVEYNFDVYVPKDIPLMKTLTTTINLKYGL